MSDAQNATSGGTITRRFFSGATVTVNAAGNTSSYTYDGLSRRLSSVMDLRVGGDGSGAIDTSNSSNPDGHVTLTSVWDGDSRLKSQTDDKGNTTSYLFDALNRRTTETFADSTANQYVFDHDDNVTSMTDENGSVRTNAFDSANRLTQVSVSRSVAFNVIGTTLQTWQYDGLHRMTLCTDNNDPATVVDDSTVTFAFDSLSRVIEEVQSLNDGMSAKTVTSDWFAHAQRVGLTYPNGRKLTFAFDNLERMIDIRNFGAGSPLFAYAYIGDRILVRNCPANGTRLTYLDNGGTLDVGYDAVRRIVDHRNLKNSDNSIIAEFVYGYNRENHRLFEKRLHDIDGMGRAKGERYAYDSLYRVVDFREGRFDTNNNVVPGTETETQNWTLDGVGNWATTVQDGATKTQSINNVNEYTAFAGVGNVYDNNGNYVDDGNFTYKWDFLNRFREVRRKSDGALLASYVYDAATAQNRMFGSGRRVRRETTASANVGAMVEKYSYDGPQCIEERGGTDLVTRQHIVGRRLDEWLVMDRDTNGDGLVDTSGFLHKNALGSIAAVTDGAGNVLERTTYGAYGKPLFENANNTPASDQVQSGARNPHLMAGYRFDPEAGLSYVRHRYLHHGRGRWLGREPMGIWASLSPIGNGYAYVSSDPINVRDSNGLEGVMDVMREIIAKEHDLEATSNPSPTDLNVYKQLTGVDWNPNPARRIYSQRQLAGGVGGMQAQASASDWGRIQDRNNVTAEIKQVGTAQTAVLAAGAAPAVAHGVMIGGEVVVFCIEKLQDKGFDPNNQEDQQDEDYYYHWDENPHRKRGGAQHWDRGNKKTGKQEWSPDGENWYPK